MLLIVNATWVVYLHHTKEGVAAVKEGGCEFKRAVKEAR
jgi:hypothetical protein